MKIFNFWLLVDFHFLGCPEYDSTISEKSSAYVWQKFHGPTRANINGKNFTNFYI